jgi:hypothetical protein
MQVLGFFDDVPGGTQGVTKDKVGQVGMLQGHCPEQYGFFLSWNPQGHPAIVFDGYAGHGGIPSSLYAFK